MALIRRTFFIFAQRHGLTKRYMPFMDDPTTLRELEKYIQTYLGV